VHVSNLEVGDILKLGYKVSPRCMRRTFQDLARAASIGDIVTRAISGHATPEMQRHYSTVAGDEVRAGLAKVIDIATGRERRVGERVRLCGDAHCQRRCSEMDFATPSSPG